MNIKNFNNKWRIAALFLILGVIGKYAYSSIIIPWYSQQVEGEIQIRETEALEYLKNSIYEGMTLDEIMTVFQKYVSDSIRT